MAVTVDSVKKFFPEFSDVDAERVQMYLDMASRSFSAEYFGSVADDALLFLTGHMLTVDGAGSGSAPGQVIAETVGSVSQQYAVNSQSSNTEYGTTPYGRRYMQLVQQQVPLRTFWP